jgi:hypothetical protein
LIYECRSFYCIVLLSALFVSSCYWQPFPVDNPLAVPWSENITTFSQALNASLPDLNLPQPSVIRAADRCWCDFSTGNFFEPYNLSQWERASVQKLKMDLELQKRMAEAQELEQQKSGEESQIKPAKSVADPATTAMPKTPTPRGTPRGILDILWSIYQDTDSVSRTPSPESTPAVPDTAKSWRPSALSTEAQERLPLLRREYDLRPYGMDMVIDFGWSQS